MTESSYTPPKVWKWDAESGGRFASINRPIAGPTHDQELPVGEHPLQVHSLATPNGVKVTVLLEELLAIGKPAEYDAYLINIGKGEQFSSGFVAINPNSKIPALARPEHFDRDTDTGFRIRRHLALSRRKVWRLDAKRPERCAPSACRGCSGRWAAHRILGGGFGHFYAYAPEKFEYPISRFAMEVKRQLDVLDRNLADRQAILGGDEYTIADIATCPWYGNLVLGDIYQAAEFLDVASYEHVVRWAKEVQQRPAYQRGERVNKAWGPEELRVPERHSASDLD